MTVTLSASTAPQVSRVRTVLFGGLALVWFGETLFTAITLASIAYAGLVGLLPLRQIVSHPGWNCSTSPVLIPFVPLLVG